VIPAIEVRIRRSRDGTPPATTWALPALDRFNQPPKRVVAEGCRGKELHRVTIYSRIYAGVPFRSDIRNQPTIRSSGCVQLG
jgi:hypothetical protein